MCAYDRWRKTTGILQVLMPSEEHGSLSLRLRRVQILCTHISLAALGVPLSSNVDGKKCPTGVKMNRDLDSTNSSLTRPAYQHKKFISRPRHQIQATARKA